MLKNWFNCEKSTLAIVYYIEVHIVHETETIVFERETIQYKQ